MVPPTGAILLDRFGSDPRPAPRSVYLSASSHLPSRPREITVPDKTRGTLSKGAYIYETFGKQMDKSNISEAERRSSLRSLGVFLWIQATPTRGEVSEL